MHNYVNITNKYTDNIREDLQSLLNSYLNKQLSDIMVSGFELELKNLFYYYGLEELQWFVSIVNYTLTIEGIRNIDTYALRGIWNND